MFNKKTTILTRDSFLALAQTVSVSQRLMDAGYDVNVVALKTSGDVQLNSPLYKISESANAANSKEGKAYFTKELEDGLLQGKGDLAVHSLKDLPTNLPDGLILSAAIDEESKSDTIISLEPVPEGTRLVDFLHDKKVGSSSLRRIALMKYWIPGVHLVSLRGNLITRFEKLLYSGEVESLLLATAGIKRLFHFYDYWKTSVNMWENKLSSQVFDKICVEHERLTKIKKSNLYFYELDKDSFVPAVSQGILGLETTLKKEGSYNLLINDSGLAARVKLERSLMSLLEAGCHIPFGCYVTLVKKQNSSETYFKLRLFFAEGFLPEKGFKSRPLFLTRNIPCNYNQNDLQKLLAELKGSEIYLNYCGLDNDHVRSLVNGRENQINVTPLIQVEKIHSVVASQESYDYAVVTSKTVVEYLPQKLPFIKQWFAIGEKTAELFSKKFPDYKVEYLNNGNSKSMGEELNNRITGKNILTIAWFGPLNGRQEGINILKENNHKVDVFSLYETRTINYKKSYHDIKRHKNNAIEWWVFTSPSSARAYIEQDLYKKDHLISVIGETTAEEFFKSGIIPYHISSKNCIETQLNEIDGLNESKDLKISKWG